MEVRILNVVFVGYKLQNNFFYDLTLEAKPCFWHSKFLHIQAVQVQGYVARSLLILRSLFFSFLPRLCA